MSDAQRLSLFNVILDKTIKPKIRHPRRPVSEYFGYNTFGLGQMREKLPADAYQGLLKTLEQGKKLDKKVAHAVALVVKEWAVAKGATHFCHWFQPMTGLTAEKHDAFISVQTENHSELRVMEKFTGDQLIQGEPDASSFPSGGMRTTFEARGYTAWDPTSPIFLVEGEHAKTVCIPSVFFSYHGESLDNKMPLLRSIRVLNERACQFLKLIGDVDVKSVTATLGVEQEYFLVDKRFAAGRPDLLMTGRTVLGAPSKRGQQLEDHYFGSIPLRVYAFMEDLEQELYKLGIPIKTRHNEVAPSQFELAPVFENVNIATDHNTLTMETLKRVAKRHGLLCLLHEKPFANINGNGKHCNWSIRNDKGENLLEPGKTPHQNLRFLSVLSIVLVAVKRHAGFLRATVASAGNDHRLGANEAPPAIISVFLGTTLNKIFDAVESGEVAESVDTQMIELGVAEVPNISKDNTDRNRTSPFAFTGNKFEYRAVGSSMNVSMPMTVLNAAVAEVFAEASHKLNQMMKTQDRDEAVLQLVKEYIIESKVIRFEGNNYSKEWKTEAKKRGLPILETTVDALSVMKDSSSIEFLTSQKILSLAEIQSRYNVFAERYVKIVMIELTTLQELVTSYVVPVVETQLTNIMKAHQDIQSSELKAIHSLRIEMFEKIFLTILKELENLIVVIGKIETLKTDEEKMQTLISKALPIKKALRDACDTIEPYVSDDLWALPKYREILFAQSVT